MTLQQLYYAVTTADYGSMNKAAEALFISQPTLTSAVKELEAELGISVFRRTGRGVVPTQEGEDFLIYARQLCQQYEMLRTRYGAPGKLKRKFGVSSQHYSFAVKAFVETVKKYDTQKYEFAMREGKTMDVIKDVSSSKSEIGILYKSDFNRKIIEKYLRDSELCFNKLITCRPYVYIWSRHPLASRGKISFSDLADYPCLSFEQGEKGSFYLSEEILSTNEYPRIIKAADRATMLNLMIGLNGYTLCSGIICEELNGSDYVAVPFSGDAENPASTMDIGYIVKKSSVMSELGETYINEMKKYLEGCV